MDRTILGRSDGRARASLGRRRARRALVADLQLAQPLPQLVALLLALLLSATSETHHFSSAHSNITATSGQAHVRYGRY